jgi:outer membrane protein assembly factor BamD
MLFRGSHRHFYAALIASVAIFTSSSQSGPIRDLFKNDLESIPDSEKLLKQEKQSALELSRAMNHESRGDTRKALSIHKAIVRDYPLCSAASTSQFKIGELYKIAGKHNKAFDAFQQFIENYTGSPFFSDALRYQYEIAREGQGGNSTKMILGIIPRKTQTSDLLKWHGKIISNAPHSGYAPLSQFAIAQIYESEEKTAMAIAAYEALVDKYPKHPKSAEAQFKIGAISRSEINRGSQDFGNITSARDAMEDVIVAYKDSERADQARKALAQFDLIEADRLYEIGRFYEKQQQYRSAIVYYEKVLKFKSSSHLADAKQRHASLLIRMAPPKTDDTSS